MLNYVKVFNFFLSLILYNITNMQQLEINNPEEIAAMQKQRLLRDPIHKKIDLVLRNISGKIMENKKILMENTTLDLSDRYPLNAFLDQFFMMIFDLKRDDTLDKMKATAEELSKNEDQYYYIILDFLMIFKNKDVTEITMMTEVDKDLSNQLISITDK